MSKFYIIGPMGSGKSTLAQSLSIKFSWPYIDTDELIKVEVGMSISEYVNQSGEKYFRDQETLAIRESSRLGKGIISLGGGAIIRRCNRELISTSGKIIYLKTSPKCSMERIESETKNRFLLDGVSMLEILTNLQKQRGHLYESLADYVISTDNKTAEDVANIVCGFVEKEISCKL